MQGATFRIKKKIKSNRIDTNGNKQNLKTYSYPRKKRREITQNYENNSQGAKMSNGCRVADNQRNKAQPKTKLYI